MAGLNYDTLLMALGANIRRRRKELKLTQDELAARVGISRNHLNKIEVGTRNSSVWTLAKLAHAMRTTVNALTTGV